jgi:signal transduction histidine kinase
MKKLIALIVDDDISMQVFLKNTLIKDNFIVEVVSSGEDAIKKIPQLKPDIVLLDVNMPQGISGYETCEKIRSQPENLYLPIMMVTGLDDVGSINKAYEVGATDFTTKPINPALIGHRIRYVIRSGGNAIRLKNAENEILALNANLEKLVEKRTQQLNSALADLQMTQQELIKSAKIASLGQVVYGMAHEMGTPIGIALSAVTYIQTELDNISKIGEKKIGKNEEIESAIASCREAKTLVENNLRRASVLIGTLRNIPSEFRSTKKAEINVKQFLQELIALLINRENIKDIEFKIDCADDVKLMAYSDVFFEVFSALVINSVQHAFGSGQKSIISIAAKETQDYCELIYEDNGKGFAPGAETKIFEPFYTTKRGEGHPGLGLNIVYNYIKNTLGGDIVYSKRENGKSGVKFIIKIPEGG